MRTAQRDAAGVSTRYLRAQDVLSAIRAQVLVSSVLVRDTLLDPDSALATAQRVEIERAHDAIDDQLRRYVPFVGSLVERERLASLRSEALGLRRASEDALMEGRPLDARATLRRFLPQREAAIRVSEEVQALNRAAFVEQQKAVADRQANMQQQVLTVFGVALVISLWIGWLAFRHTARLEHRLTEQRAREERIGLDLQRLSASLVDVQEDERRRIARELHDAVGQALSAVKVELLVAQRKLAHTAWGAQLLSDAQVNADAAFRSVRDLSHLLHPATLDDLGLVAAVDSYLTEFGKRHDLAVSVVHRGIQGRYPVEVERAVYRIVQEALANVARHARAQSAIVALSADDDGLRAVIEDDGVGFDVADAEQPGRRRGLGLLSIRERALQLGGTVSVTSGVAAGTRLLVQFPSRPQPTRVLDASNAVAGPSLLAGAPEVGHG
jgi:signal transduction histidine kinase